MMPLRADEGLRCIYNAGCWIMRKRGNGVKNLYFYIWKRNSSYILRGAFVSCNLLLCGVNQRTRKVIYKHLLLLFTQNRDVVMVKTNETPFRSNSYTIFKF
ncbi:Os02g0124800 [Oryza sativa Japonica Group]|uniref:Os02g0124800 protein n=1 Tax=Oryza sativa subsp. japonica TaxID=39947 RepID=Q0E4D3_ORYSJ|nr:Os02g0124800 [Oryza sativa Japonica Group]|eukprot:NP_001045741.1 Os02g0124800 [Oryza sativa Japonica Group]